MIVVVIVAEEHDWVDMADSTQDLQQLAVARDWLSVAHLHYLQYVAYHLVVAQKAHVVCLGMIDKVYLVFVDSLGVVGLVAVDPDYILGGRLGAVAFEVWGHSVEM